MGGFDQIAVLEGIGFVIGFVIGFLIGYVLGALLN
jgi:predicted lysophospholipase L1 biosynthesis ABC-type transport system permease subunit